MAKHSQRLVLKGDVLEMADGRKVKVKVSQYGIFDQDEKLVLLLGQGVPKFAARQIAREMS